MSLHGEYGFHVSYFYDHYERERIQVFEEPPERRDVDGRGKSGIVFQHVGAVIGLSVYF